MRDDFYPVATRSRSIDNKLQCSPSVRRAFPPVGVHSTAEQLLHTTTVWLWLKTVVLQIETKEVSTHDQQHLHIRDLT